MAAFPVEESLPRARAFLRLTLRVGAALALAAHALPLLGRRSRVSEPARDSALRRRARDEPDGPRRGVASALLAEAERQARVQGLPAVALDTTLDNEAARALYAQAGFDEIAYKPPAHGLPGFVALARRLG